MVERRQRADGGGRLHQPDRGPQLRRVIGTTFRAPGGGTGGFINRYFDDNRWWALAWVAAYDLTGERRYLDTAQAIFAPHETGWDDTCGGGLWWNEDRKYKNAITNELFLTLAARLHQRVPADRGRYRDWALREWDWLHASGMIGRSGLVNDGLTRGLRRTTAAPPGPTTRA